MGLVLHFCGGPGLTAVDTSPEEIRVCTSLIPTDLSALNSDKYTTLLGLLTAIT